MFHPKDTTLENSDTMEINELKTEDRIREYRITSFKALSLFLFYY